MNYNDFIIEAVEQAALGTSGNPRGLAVMAACAGLWSRGFMAGKTTGVDLDAAALGAIGRDLFWSGESFWAQLKGEWRRLKLVQIEGAEVWSYRLQLGGPTAQLFYDLGPDRVVHVRLNTDPDVPWQGRPPWADGLISSAMATGLEKQLREESEGPSGYVLPTPQAPLCDMSPNGLWT